MSLEAGSVTSAYDQYSALERVGPTSTTNVNQQRAPSRSNRAEDRFIRNGEASDIAFSSDTVSLNAVASTSFPIDEVEHLLSVAERNSYRVSSAELIAAGTD